MTAAAAEPGQGSRPHLHGIESLRAYAAFSIIVFHVIHIAGFDPPQSLMFMKWHLGRGVPLFFAVSAFSLAYGYAGRLGAWPAVRAFYLRRLFRIAPLYYAALAFQLAANYPPGWSLAHPGELLLNLAFLFNLSPPHVEGIALASWSIGVEMLFYALFPLLLALVRNTAAALAFALASAVAAVAYAVALKSAGGAPASFIQHSLLFNLPYFGFGLAAFHLWRGAVPAAGRWVLAAAVIGMAGLWLAAGPLAAQIAQPLGDAIYQTAWALPLAALCLGMALAPPALLSNRATQFLGKISFSLYLAHPHVIGWLRDGGLYDRVRALPGGSGAHFAAAVLLTAAVVIPLAWALYRLIEAPGMSLGRAAVGRLRRRAEVAPA